jgi:hypothetical protein
VKISGPKAYLHIEGLVVLVAACVAYNSLGASWGKFALLFLVPDVSIIGYLGGRAVGARVYNAVHSYLGPALLWAVAYWSHQAALIPMGLIWAAHIGFDRLLGYGLKFPTGFKDTHLNRV